MKNKLKQISVLLSVLILLFMMSGSYMKSTAAPSILNFAGKWDFSFYDASGKLQGKKTIVIAEDGTFSEKAILNLSNVVYNTEVTGTVSPNGKVSDGNLTDHDKIDMVGTFTGSFTQSEGTGIWKNYYNQSGTWKAARTKSDNN